jgi:NAD(P)-dependent dehydrogenase (short-subunit alcohol dehydrogenase family)
MPTALVTGASTGIGQATAISLARKGYSVRAAMRNPAAAEPLAKVAAEEGLTIAAVQMDVDDDGSVTGAVEAVLAAEGRIDVLVNNAGVSGGGSVEETPLAAFRAVMETNFFGLVRVSQAVIPAMRRQRSGLIVNISSVAGRTAMAPQASYAASKFAVEALSECLAQEMKAHGVRVVIVEPGVIITPIFSKGGTRPPSGVYPNTRWLMAVFQQMVPRGSSPFVVGDAIAEIAVSGDAQLRHRVGAFGAELIDWRRDMSDEAWVALGGASDAEFAAAIKAEFGLDIQL